jgi:site-specific DNA recombinase
VAPFLVVNEAEAETVRTIYQLYLELKAVDAVREELERRGLRTKMRPGKSEHMKGGVKFSRGHLYRILANPLYTGRIAHKGKLYEGKHQAIIDPGIWDEVQATLAANSRHQLVKSRSRNPNLLTGLLFDAEGAPFLSTHAVKQGRRYRYYVSASRLKGRSPEEKQASGSKRQGWRLPAAEVEDAIIRFLTNLLTNRTWLVETIGSAEQSLQGQLALVRRGEELSQQLMSLDPVIKRSVVLGLVERIVLAEGLIELQLRPAILQGPARNQSTIEEKLKSSGLVTVTRSISLHRRSVETRLIIEGQGAPEQEPDPALIKALAQAHRWWGDLIHQRYSTMREIATAYDTDERYVARVISLAFLKADLTESILQGVQPPEITLHILLTSNNL